MSLRKLFLSLVALALGLILLDRAYPQKTAKNFTQGVFEPVLLPLHTLGLRFFSNLDFLRRLPGVYQQNQELKLQLSEMAYLRFQVQELQQENQALRNQLTIQGVSQQKLLPVQVLGRINAGEDVFLLVSTQVTGALKAGQIVVLAKNLVGRIESVSQNFARVLPIFSSRFRAAVLVGEQEAAGEIKGQIHTQVKLTKVLQSVQLKEGDLIKTSGSEGIFPRGLLVGRVGRVSSKDWQLYQEAEVEPFWDQAQLGTVFVILE